MGSFAIVIQVRASLEKTFHVFSDVAAAESRIPAITRVELLTPGASGLGTRWKESRVMFGKEATEELWISAFDPPRSYTVSCQSCGCLSESAFTFAPEGDLTRVTLTQRFQPLTIAARLMQPLSLLMMGSMKKMLMEDLQSLKNAAEEN